MLEKFIKKDKNEELEAILDEKNVEEQAKNLLQGILYKVEVSYKDYKRAKVTDRTEGEYVEEILRNIQRKCNKIETIKLSEKIDDNDIQAELEKNKFYIKDNNIISYPIEKKLLYAIEKNSNNNKIVNDKYGILAKPLSNLIMTGKNIDRIEVFRDFNGWSWTTIKSELENINANLIYQTIRILLDEEFLDGWNQDTDGIIDYVQIMKEELTNRYGEILSEQILEKIEQISIVNEIKENEIYKNEVIDLLTEVNKKIEKFENTKENIQEITESKKQASKEIKDIEKILNQESKIKQEYERRNSGVDLQHKVFSIRVLKQQLNDRKQQLLNKIEESNYLLNPSNYLYEKNELIKQKEMIEIVNYKEEQIENLLIEFEKLFLECFYLQIDEAKEQEDIVKLIYKFRYFMLLPFNMKKSIKDVKELEDLVIKVEKKLVKLAVEKKVIVNVPFEIMQHVFETRIIILEELYYKITTEFEKFFVQIFDENISEEKFEIMPKEKTKINKKIKIFIKGV